MGKHLKWLVVLSVVLSFGMMACDDGDTTGGGNSAGLDGTDLFDPGESAADMPVTGAASIGNLGSLPSDMAMYGDYIYTVDYSNNAIHRIDIRSLDVKKNYVDLGQDSGPYSVYADGDALYVMCQGKVQVLRVAHEDGAQKQVLSANELVAPTDAVTEDGYLFVSDSEFNMAEPDKTGGAIVAVVPGDKMIKRSTAAQNPGFVYVIGRGADALVASVDAGVIRFNADYSMTPPEKSCLEVWKLSEFVSERDDIRSRTFCAKDTGLGRMVVDGDRVILGDPMSPVIHTMSLRDLKSADSSDELLRTVRLSDEDYTTIMTPVALKDRVIVLDNNKSAVIWGSDAGADRYFLTKSTVAAKGPIDAMYNEKTSSLYVLNSTSGTMDVLTVK